MKNKKGISSITAGVFLILVAIVSATILGFSIKNSALDLSPALSCADLRISSPVKIVSGCFNSETNNIEVTLSRKLADNSEIKNFELSSSRGEWSCSDLCSYDCEILSPGQEKTYLVPLDENPKEIILSVNSCSLEKITLESC